MTCQTCGGRRYVVQDAEWEPIAVQCPTCGGEIAAVRAGCNEAGIHLTCAYPDCTCKQTPVIVRAALAASQSRQGAAPSLQKRPVAFRAKDALDQWLLFDNEDEAASYATDTGFEYQGLYPRDDKSPAPSASGWGMVAEGWVLVPKEPTEAMQQAGIDTSPMFPMPAVAKSGRISLDTEHCANIYRAMLASAPAPAQTEE